MTDLNEIAAQLAVLLSELQADPYPYAAKISTPEFEIIAAAGRDVLQVTYYRKDPTRKPYVPREPV